MVSTIKALILVRHAKASPKDLPIPDKDRPLRQSGKHDLLLMKDALLAEDLKPQHIFSSTANRAAQTAVILAGFYGLFDSVSFFDDLYRNDAEEMFDFIKRRDNGFERIMVVGHNPELEELTGILYNGTFEKPVPTSACICLSFGVDRWEQVRDDSGRLEYFEYPKKYK